MIQSKGVRVFRETEKIAVYYDSFEYAGRSASVSRAGERHNS